MAEAGPSSATMASAPLHHVAVAHRSDLSVFLSPNSIQLVDGQPDGTFKTYAMPTTVFVPQPTLPDQSDAARYADQPHISFARLASFSHSDRFLALTGDDKVLRVWKLQRTAEGAITGFEFGKEIVIKLLPKRAAVLHWMPSSDSTPTGSEELICIDRFGDIRSFIVNENDVRTLPSAEANAGKKHGAEVDEQDQMDSPDDASMQILLGHVSMITSLAFIPAATPTAPPAYIVTGDRDEHIRISRWGRKRLAYVIDRFLQGSEAFVGALAVLPDTDGELRLVSSEGGRALRVWTLPRPGAAASADTAFDGACLSINELSTALAPYVLARDREERKRESKALQASSKKNKRKQGGDDQLEAKPLAAQYSKDSKPTIVISDLLPYRDAEGKQWLLIVVEGATAFFSVPVSALLAPLDSEETARDISEQIQVTRASAPILHLALVQRSPSTPASVIATFDTRPEFRPEPPSPHPEAEAAVFTLSPSNHFERQASPALVSALLPASEGDASPRALLDAATVEHLGLYPALTTWPKIEVPSSAEIIATRSSRKGRFNHPLDTSLIGVAQVDETKPLNASSNPEGDDEQRRKLVKTMQGGKRERGRERNREAIRLAQEQASSL
ncbi:related to TRM82-subunit of a tRNA methyltransferase complex [Sporisorium reilianum f. sp. reilianum]|uniref:Related to TRM82-subunit of a tRNA methyltransferase complex n=1 Tax=Sporisorium reilianum f. sp. reilianum TaxID=72559 RepID=A0A2N8UP31_9BASI|nr:related to TRM82-subunit of a tRNA methyltransferase complex [Sporisorium reilianum f. sp. reilianum]